MASLECWRQKLNFHADVYVLKQETIEEERLRADVIHMILPSYWIKTNFEVGFGGRKRTLGALLVNDVLFCTKQISQCQGDAKGIGKMSRESFWKNNQGFNPCLCSPITIDAV